MKANDFEQIEFDTFSKNIHEEKSTIAQSITSSDQVPHQTVITEDGRSIDLDQKHFTVGAQGKNVFDEDGKTIAELAKKKFTYVDFIKKADESAQEALVMLLALQSNAAPLKKGGVDIAYMADIFFEHMILNFSEEATAVWEALAALQSSRPEDEVLSITPEDIRPYTNYKSNDALYHAFKKGCLEVDNFNLCWNIIDPDVDGHLGSIIWKKGSEWVGRNVKTGDSAHYNLLPSDFYRALMASSGILHGAHWNRRIARTLKGYARDLYLFCARNKEFTKYNGARKGQKELTVEETKYELQISANTAAREIWRRLQEAEKKVNELAETEFNVSISRVPAKGKIEGFIFNIKETRTVDSTAKEVVEPMAIEDKELFNEIKMLFSISKIEMSENQLIEIANSAKANNKNGQEMMQIISNFQKRIGDGSKERIHSYVDYIKQMIANDTSTTVSKNSFNNINQNIVDFDELEAQLLDN